MTTDIPLQTIRRIEDRPFRETASLSSRLMLTDQHCYDRRVKVSEVTREGDAIVVMLIERASKSRSGRQMKLELDDEEARRLMNALRVVLAKGA